VVRAPGAALAARLSCGARSLGIEPSWWRREWSERELITLETGYNVSMFAALCRGGGLSVRGAVSVGFCSRTIVLSRQPNNIDMISYASHVFRATLKLDCLTFTRYRNYQCSMVRGQP